MVIKEKVLIVLWHYGNVLTLLGQVHDSPVGPELGECLGKPLSLCLLFRAYL